MKRRLAKIQMLQRSLTTAVRYAEELGYQVEIEVLDHLKLTIARRANDELELFRAAERLADTPSKPPSEE